MATSAVEPQQQEQDTRVVATVTPAASAALSASPVVQAIDRKALLDEVVPSSPPSPSLSSPPPSQESSQPPAAPATVARESDRPRLKVVIPPVPPFLHEVDKRNERERARRMQLTADSKRPTDAAQQVDVAECANDADADYQTPEKQIQNQPTFKRKTRGGSELDDPEQVLVFQESEYRMSQITPPPSERMLDHKNPPLPPRKTKKRRRIERPVNPITGRMTFSALPLPRLSLSSETSSSSSGFSMPSPPQLDTPPGSPVRMSSVFRSLADEFAAVQDTPPVRTLRPPPRITRSATRQCTPPISSRTRSAIQTPTTTMVLRSRQLNPSSKT